METKNLTEALPEPARELTIAEVRIGPAYDESVHKLINEIAGIKRSATALQIKDDTGAETVTDDLTITKDLKKALETLRKSYTVPLNDYLSNINETFKAITIPLTEAQALFDGKLLAWIQYKREQAEKLEEIERQKVALAQAEAEVTGEEPPVFQPVKQEPVSGMTRGGLGTSNTQANWQWEITDESKIPREYLMIDSSKLTKVVKTWDCTVEGTGYTKEEVLAESDSLVQELESRYPIGGE